MLTRDKDSTPFKLFFRAKNLVLAYLSGKVFNTQDQPSMHFGNQLLLSETATTTTLNLLTACTGINFYAAF